VLFYLRAVDEIKDYDYDRQFNPDRPLVTGMVNRTDLHLLMAALAGLTLVINLGAGPTVLGVLLLNLVWGYALIWLERLFPIIARSIFVNLAVTYPVNVLLSIYLLLLSMQAAQVPLSWAAAGLVLAYALAFLHFEFARKTTWTNLSAPTENLYSNAIGTRRSAALALGCALAGVLLYLLISAPWQQAGLAGVTGWLPLLALLPAGLGVFKLLGNTTTRQSLRGPAILFLVGFYISILLHALVANRWSF
jgi:hypothetical protein